MNTSVMNVPEEAGLKDRLTSAPKWTKLVLSLLLTLSVGAISGWITMDQVNNWYFTIQKPSFTPPNGVFGPVWTVLYVLIGYSFYRIWKKPLSEERNAAIFLFLLQLMFNFLWTVLFFEFHQVGWAMICMVVLWLFILLTIFDFDDISKTAAWTMVPYICWVTFTGLLNFYIWKMNW